MVATRKHLKSSDLRATAQLASAATAGLVDLVEAVHARIARLPLAGAAPDAANAANAADAAGASGGGRTSGITGLVYKTVRGVTQVVGGSVDALLGWLEPAVTDPASALATSEREAVLAALNGVLGDRLAASGNALATSMSLRAGGQSLVLERKALATRLPKATGRVLVLVHGLCMNDLQWQREGHDHGATLARAAGYTPVYLHYNSGLPVASNGLQFAALLEDLLAQWPAAVERFAIVGHSMGGLVARSAIHAGMQAGMAWPAQLDDLVCLGTPHQGSPLEKAGHGLDLLLAATPFLSNYSAPFARLGKLRSAGITDLRHGHVLGTDNAVQPASDRAHVPMPANVRCYAVAAVLGQLPPPGKLALKERISSTLLGDGLVPLASALGQHKSPKFNLAFAPERQCVVEGTGHMALLSSAAVAQQLQRWLA